MSKYLSLPVATTEDSGTASATTADKLVEAGQNFESTVTVGSIVYNTADDTSATVTAVDSDTTLSISANIMASGETYVILSASLSSSNQLIAMDYIANVTASDDVTAVITLGTLTNDVVTIDHAPNTNAVSLIQAGMLNAASNNSRPDPSTSVEGGSNGLIINSVTIA